MRSRSLALVLAISVALNLFFAGVFTARLWQRAEVRTERQAHGPRPRREPRHVEPFRWLSDAERRELRPRRKALRALRDEAEQLLRAEHFDSAKLTATLEALRRETDAIQASVHGLLIRRAETLSADQRRRLADAWTARGDGGDAKGLGAGGGRGQRRPGKPTGDEK